MELTLWTYEGPPHVGAMRVASSMKDIHYVLHAPQGDTYADLLFTMIERRGQRPPVTYTTFQARDLGGDTAELVKRNITEAVERFKPKTLLVGESCTAELIQDQPGALAKGMGFDIPIVNLELPAYSKKENWGASETFYQIIRTLLKDKVNEIEKINPKRWKSLGRRPKVNILGPTLLGFRCRDDVIEIQRILSEQGIDTNVVAPLGSTPDDISRLTDADINICLYQEIAETSCEWLKRNYGMEYTTTIPIGIKNTINFINEVHEKLDLPLANQEELEHKSKLPWYSKSVDSNYLTGKRVFIFGDGTHAIAAAKIAKEELGFEVVGLGTYSREMARQIRATAKDMNIEALITNNYLEVEDAMKKASPELVLGTQMERHSAKRLGIPCAVISTPMHVQDVPANVIFDDWVHPLMMGLEEHLIDMFKHDFEFVDGHQSHLGHTATKVKTDINSEEKENKHKGGIIWTESGRAELTKVPFFVRGKVKTNTEKYAISKGIPEISDETLYDAKAFFG